ncbi:MAG: hypothetical protein GY880_01250 [Planctomycetaceae bacterium]|nr:hypothetical protein [Planctomycetaceae bacterium]
MRLIIVSSFAIFTLLFWPVEIRAQNRVPIVKYKVTTSQFGVTHSQGIHPLRVAVDLVPPKPVVNDQEFVAKVTTSYRHGLSFETIGSINILAGKTSGTVDLMLPASGDIQWVQLEIQKPSNGSGGNNNNILYQNLEIENLGVPVGRNSQNKLLIGKTNTPEFGNEGQIDNRQIFLSNGQFVTQEVSLTQPPMTYAGPAVSLKKIQRNNISYSTIRAENLPENWIGLSGFDQIFISSNEFRDLSKANEIQRDNLEKWVAAGGALVIYSCGQDYRETGPILSLLIGEARASQLVAGEYRWCEPINVSTTADVWCAGRSVGYSIQNTVLEKVVRPFATSLSVKAVDNPGLIDPEKFGILSYLNGCIISVDDDMSSWTRGDYRRLDNSVALNGSSLAARIGYGSGLLPVLTIPGVGEPPVLLFKVLLTIFLIVAGPIALFAFSKLGKPQLLLVLIPLLSICVSCALILYVLLADGLTKTASVQSAITLDQRTNLAVVNCRAAYFSNFTSLPYKFSPDTLVGLTDGIDTSSVRLDQSASQTRISGKALMARTLHELTTFGVRSVSEELVFESGDVAKDSLPKATNNLGGKVVFAIFRDENDDYYLLKDSEPGAVRSLEKIQVRGDERLIHYAAGRIEESKRKNFPSVFLQSIYLNVPGHSLGFGDNEVVLKEARLSALLSSRKSYVAFLEELPLVTDEFEAVNYKKQNHVVLGRW